MASGTCGADARRGCGNGWDACRKSEYFTAPATASASRICSSAPGSSIVVRSPGSRPSASAWIERRSSLPERVLGSSVTKCTRAGPRDRAELAVDRVHHLLAHRATPLRRVATRAGSLTTANATGTWPFSGSATPTTATSAMPGVRLHRFLDLARAEAMAGDVDHVVGAAEHEVVAVGVAHRPVERRVDQLAGKVEKYVLTKRSSSPQTVVMQPGRQRRHDREHAFLVGADFRAGGLVRAGARRSRRPGTTGCRTCAASPRRPAARTGSASRSRSASSCRRSARRARRTPSARSARRAARRRGTGSAGVERSCFFMYAGSCFFSTRIAVGELNIVLDLVLRDDLPPDRRDRAGSAGPRT